MKQPHYGGHIERLIGTQMGAVHLLPGTTFSHPGKRWDYPSSQAAVMTLRELERWIAWEVAGHYHQRIHASLHRRADRGARVSGTVPERDEAP